jgi:hypothetical protein
MPHPAPPRPAFAGLLLLAVLLAPPLAAQPAGTSTLSGTVSNLVTGNLLEGARVELPAAGLSALTDNTGRYVLPSVPAGSHEVVVTYTGLDPARTQVARHHRPDGHAQLRSDDRYL